MDLFWNEGRATWVTKREHSTIQLRVLPARTIASHDSTSNQTTRTPGHDPRVRSVRLASLRSNPPPTLQGPTPPLPTPRPYTSQPSSPTHPEADRTFHAPIPPCAGSTDSPSPSPIGRSGWWPRRRIPPTRYKYPTSPATPWEIPPFSTAAAAAAATARSSCRYPYHYY